MNISTQTLRSHRVPIIALILCLFTAAASAQVNAVDPTFISSPAVSITEASGNNILVGPDNKPVIWGRNYVVDGVAKGPIVRLNTDGSLDTTFDYCECGGLPYITNVFIQPDGKILVAGTSAFSASKIIRLNLDGSIDPTFGFTRSPALSAEVNAVQADGKILVTLYSSFTGFHTRDLIRLNPDGTADAGFTSYAYDGGRLITTFLRALVIDMSGKIYGSFTTYSGGSSTASLRRLNSDGTVDNTFTAPSISSTGSFQTDIIGLALQSDGSLIVTGRFDTINGVNKSGIVRILPAGNVDLNFAAAIGSTGGQVKVVSGDKILVSPLLTGNPGLVRLNADGTIDNTFAADPGVSVASAWAVDSSERILFLGRLANLELRFVRLNSNGALDANFNTNAALFAKIYALARQADGKIIAAGTFTQFNGTARRSIVRVNTDGTLDPTFDGGTGFDQPPTVLFIQPDGKIIAGGSFTTYNGVPKQSIVRLNSNGSLDAAFDPVLPASSTVDSITAQADGKLIIAGAFASVNGTARTSIARLNTGGSLDDTFNPVFGNAHLYAVVVQPDGRIVVGGSFSGVNGFNRSGLVRLESNGTLDTGFTAAGLTFVDRLIRQSDGKLIYSNDATVGRRNADGSADASFAVSTFESTDSNGRTIDALALQPDGTVVVGGRFDRINSTTTRRNLARLSPAGALDLLFLPSGADDRVRTAVGQPDGKVVIGGDFAHVADIRRDAIARLTLAPFRKKAPFDFDGDGKADIAVYRASDNTWYQLFSSGGPIGTPVFGIPGDIPVPADFDGDGRTDLAIFRPSNGDWWYRASGSGALINVRLGASGDIPRPTDIDGDGKADMTVFRPSNSTWYRIGSVNPTVLSTAFGIPGDQPLVGDFDGDGKGDLAVFRPSTGDWWWAASASGGAFRTAHWGANGDIPVAADFDGDGKTDTAVFRPSEGGWYIYNSGSGSVITMTFGLPTDRPVAADYDGDGKADIAVFRPSTGIWYLLQSTAGFGGVQWGIATDVTVPGAFTP